VCCSWGPLCACHKHLCEHSSMHAWELAWSSARTLCASKHDSQCAPVGSRQNLCVCSHAHEYMHTLPVHVCFRAMTVACKRRVTWMVTVGMLLTAAVHTLSHPSREVLNTCSACKRGASYPAMSWKEAFLLLLKLPKLNKLFVPVLLIQLSCQPIIKHAIFWFFTYHTDHCRISCETRLWI